MTDYTITILDISHQELTELTELPDDIDKYTNLKTLICWNNPLKYNFAPTLENIRNYNSSKMLSS